MSDVDGELVMPVVMQSVDELSGMIAEVQIPEGTVIKNADGDSFMGDILPPEFIDPEIVEETVSQDVVAAIDVGADEHVQFEDAS